MPFPLSRVSNTESDRIRFKDIVRGKVKNDLRRIISHGELIGKRGKDLVSIPVTRIDIPRFRFNPRKQKGIGAGDGEIGTGIGPANDPGGSGAGADEGHHIMEVEVSLDELAEMLGEKLKLPPLLPKGKRNIDSEKDRYTTISRHGPESLRHFKRTYRFALRRQMIEGTYDPKNPRIIPIKSDRYYKSWKPHKEPDASAAVIYMMDVSGSMGDEQKDIVRTEAFWIDTWLRHNFKNVTNVYMVHDATAREVDEHTFYHTRESGGTVISSAYDLCNELIDTKFPPDDWNIFVFHFTDGDNFDDADTRKVLTLIGEKLAGKINQVSVVQVASAYGDGDFGDLVDDMVELNKDKLSRKVVVSFVGDRDDIYKSLREIFNGVAEDDDYESEDFKYKVAAKRI